MGAASGGRLTLWLLALAVLIASGATGVVATSGGSPPPDSGGSGPMLGSSDQRSDQDRPATAQAQPQPTRSATAPDPARAAAEAAAVRRAARYNVGAAHSPELLQALAGGPASAGSGNQPRGVDVAADQHPGGASIDWAQVAAAGYSFAAVKATEGDYYANPYYAADAAGARAAGLPVTGYHVAIPNVSGGAAQAGYAVSHLGRGTALELDLEYDPYTATDHTNQCYGRTAPQLVAWIGAFTRQAQRLTGQVPIIYTTAAWWRACTGDSTAFSTDSLWLAGPGQPVLPATWASYSYWEFTSTGTVPGIAGRGSVNVSYGSRRTTPYAPAVAGAAGVAGVVGVVGVASGAGVTGVAGVPGAGVTSEAAVGAGVTGVAGAAGGAGVTGAAGVVQPAARTSRPPAAAAAPPVAVSAGAAASAVPSTPGGPVGEVAPRPAATAPSPVAPEASPSPGSRG